MTVFLLAITLFAALQTSAQSTYASHKRLAHEPSLRFERITVNEGLSDNNALCIMQDRTGFLWFGTWNGLNRYDGYTFTNYYHDPRDTNTLSFNVIYTMHEANDGTIWLAVAGDTLNKFNPKTKKFSRFIPNHSGAKPVQLTTLRTIVEDNEGMIWTGNTAGEVGRIDKRTNCFVNWNKTNFVFNLKAITRGRNSAIAKIYKSRNGNLWIASNSGLFEIKFKHTRKSKEADIELTQFKHEPGNPNSLSNDQITSIFEDRSGIMWIGTMSGLNRFDVKNNDVTRFVHDSTDDFSISNSRISGIAEDKLGNLWVATRYGLNRLEKNGKRFTRFLHDPNNPFSLGSNIIFSLLIDRSNILWIATLGSGINKLNLNQSSIALYRHDPFNKNSLSQDKVTSICEDKTGKIWIGTAGGGLNCMDKSGNFKHYLHNPKDSASIGSNQINCIMEDSDGNLWIGGGRNANQAVLSKYNHETCRFSNYIFSHSFSGPPNGNPFLAIYEDRKKKLWLGTTDGYYIFDKYSGTAKHVTHDPANQKGISDFWVNCIYEDKNGYFWLGPNSNDMNRLDPVTQKIKRFKHDPRDSTTISSGVVKSIFEDSQGNVWFATRSGGLCKLNADSETFRTFTTRDGLPSNTIYSVIEDNHGYLWLTTNKGLCRFHFPSGTVTNFDIDDGLQGNQFEAEVGTPSASFKGRDGTLYFGGPNGFNVLNPSQLQLNTQVPPVVITQFKVFDRVLPDKSDASEIVLGHDQNFFSFEFAALNYINSSKNKYAYKLEGVDKDWIYCDNRRFANYTNIDPGKYVFRVKGSNNSGLWNQQGSTMTVTILPPWWKTWWFYLAATVAIAVITFSFYKYRMRQRMKIFAIRNRLHRDLHDDVGSTLSSVKAYSEILLKSPENPAISSLIKENASEMIDRLQVISWATNPQHDNFKSLEANMLNYARPLLHAHNIELVYECSLRADLVIPGDVRQNIFLIFKEAVNNTIKYANASEFKLEFSWRNRNLSLIISDNGTGCDGTIKGGGRGMKNMQKRASEMHGKIFIESCNGRGTQVELVVDYPFKNTKFMG